MEEMHPCRLLFVGVWLSAALAHAAGAGASLEGAQRAVSELRWAEARSELDALLRAGGLEREQLVRAYEMRAEVTAVLDGAEAAEREYRKLLALDPTHPPPRRGSPVFMTPYQRARRWVGEAGPLRLNHQPPAAVPVGVTIALRVQLHDPLGLTAAVRAVGEVGGESFALSPPRLPPLGEGARASYRLDALDAGGSLLASLGAETPFAVRAEPPPATLATPLPSPTAPAATQAVTAPPLSTASTAPPRRARLWQPAVGLGVSALALGGAAVGLNFAARSEFDSLQQRCKPNCTANDLSRLHAEEASGIALYTIAAVTGAASIVLAIVDRLRR
jgi:hypothetical protein